MFLGLLLPFIAPDWNWIGATVIFDNTPPKLYKSSAYPSGGSDSPTPLAAGETIKICIYISDEESWIESAKVTITYPTGTVKTLNLAPESVKFGDPGSYKASWTVPTTSGKYKFEWQAEDAAGNRGSVTTYGCVGSPDGYFKIEGKKAGQTTTIVVKVTKLTIEFIATKFGSDITDVYVQAREPDGKGLLKWTYLTEVENDKRWKTEFDLTREFQTYGNKLIVEGYIYTPSKKYRKMSILVQLPGLDGWSPPSWIKLLNPVTIIGLIVTAAGLVLESKRRGG